MPSPALMQSSTATPIRSPASSKVDLAGNPGTISIPLDGGDGISVDIPDTVRDRLPPGTLLNIDLVEYPTDGNLGSAVVDLTLTDSQGQTISFAGKIELCFSLTGAAAEFGCLGYYDEECDEWVCEDRSLRDKQGKVCGSTGHFTSFALLIGTNLYSACGEGAPVDQVIAYLSVGLAVVAIVIVSICVVGKEITVRFRRCQIEGQFGRSDRVWKIENADPGL